MSGCECLIEQWDAARIDIPPGDGNSSAEALESAASSAFLPGSGGMHDIVLENRRVLSTWRVPLARSYAARFGAPVVTHVDPLIFVRKFFAYCMDCDFCHDSCCQFGCDTSLATVANLETSFGEALEEYTGTSRGDWFEPEIYADGDFPGGRYRSTKVVNGTCIFKNKTRRGCGIHSYCLENGLDYHDIKPVLCWLFPLTVETGALCPQNVVLEKSL